MKWDCLQSKSVINLVRWVSGVLQPFCLLMDEKCLAISFVSKLQGDGCEAARQVPPPRVLHLLRLRCQPQAEGPLFCGGQDLLREACTWTGHPARGLRCGHGLPKVKCQYDFPDIQPGNETGGNITGITWKHSRKCNEFRKWKWLTAHGIVRVIRLVSPVLRMTGLWCVLMLPFSM